MLCYTERGRTMIIEVRCPKCDRKLAEAEGVIIVKCHRCKTIAKADTKTKKIFIIKNT